MRDVSISILISTLRGLRFLTKYEIRFLTRPLRIFFYQGNWTLTQKLLIFLALYFCNLVVLHYNILSSDYLISLSADCQDMRKLKFKLLKSRSVTLLVN